MFLRSRLKSYFNFATVYVVGLIAAAMMPLHAFALPDFLEPVELGNIIHRQIAKQDIDTNLSLYSISLLNGVTTSAHYRYEAEPSYIDSYYARYDTYSIEDSVEPSAWISSIGAPFSFGFSAGTDVVFVRQFKTQKEAVTAAPYWLNHLPVSADRALTNLSIGDFVSFQTQLTFAVTLQQSTPVAGIVSLAGATHALISGDFVVHLYKVDDKHLRMKLIAVHDIGAGISAGLTVNNGITLIALNVVNHQLRRAWNVDLGTLARDYDLSDLYMIDYVLDLTHPRVAAAYNELMQKKAMLKSIEMFNPLPEKQQLQNTLVSDFTEFEKLYHEDKDKPKDARAVDRLFKGSTLIKSVKNSLNFDIRVLRFRNQTLFAENHVSTIDSNENPQYFVFDTFSHSTERRMPFHFFDRSEYSNSDLLFTSSSDFTPVNFVGLFLNREIRAQSLDQDGLNEIKNHLKNTLPPSLYKQIPVNHWDLSQHEGVNVYFRHEFYFAPEALKAIPALDAATLKRRYQDFLGTLNSIDAEPTRKRNLVRDSEQEEDTYDPNATFAELYDYDLDIISKEISIAFNPKLEVGLRHDAFIQLKNNDLFVETGPGFLIYLLPQDRLNQLLGYSLVLTGRDLERINFTYGEPTQSDLYRSMLYIQDLLNARTVDLRLLQDVGGASAPPSVPSATP